jgi:hypothetical protein
MLLQRNRHRRRKLFLPPGYIALSLFVWVASLCVLKHEKACFETVLEANYIKELPKNTIQCYRIFYTDTIRLMDDDGLFKKQIVKIDRLLQSYSKSMDKKTRICFEFSESRRWNDIIQLIDLGASHRFIPYFNNANSLVFFRMHDESEKTVQRPRQMLCGSGMMYMNNDRLKWNAKLEELQKQAHAERVGLISPFFLPHAFLLLFFGLISFGKLRKQNT